MSMECDTRLAMMAMRDRAEASQTAHRPAPRHRTTRVRRFSTEAAATMAAFALTLFTRTA